MEQQDREAMMCELVVNRALDFVGALGRDDVLTPPKLATKRQTDAEAQPAPSLNPPQRPLPYTVRSGTVIPQQATKTAGEIAPTRRGHDDSTSSVERTPGPNTKHRSPSHVREDEEEEAELGEERQASGPLLKAPGAWVMVSRLDPMTTDDSLMSLFFPYGANSAFLMSDADGKKPQPSTTTTASTPTTDKRKIGFVQFPSEAHAALAVSKMNHFIPCHQSQALIVVRCSHPWHQAASAEGESSAAGGKGDSSFESTTSAAATGTPEKHYPLIGGSVAEQLHLLLSLNTTTPPQIAGFIDTASKALSAQAVIDVALSFAMPLCESMLGTDTTPSMQSTPTKDSSKRQVHRTRLLKITAALGLVREEHKRELQVAVVRQLLSIILMGADGLADADPPSPNAASEPGGKGDDEHGSAEQDRKKAVRCIAAGVLLGLLFAYQFVVGDANSVGAKLLRSEILEPFQIVAITQLVRHAVRPKKPDHDKSSDSIQQGTDESPTQSAGNADHQTRTWRTFWDQLQELSVNHPLAAVRALAARECQFQSPLTLASTPASEASTPSQQLQTPPRIVPIRTTTPASVEATAPAAPSFPTISLPPWGFVPYPHPQFSHSNTTNPAFTAASPKGESKVGTDSKTAPAPRQLSPLAPPFVSSFSSTGSGNGGSPPSLGPQQQQQQQPPVSFSTMPFGFTQGESRSPSPPDYNRWSAPPPASIQPLLFNVQSPQQSGRTSPPSHTNLSPLGARRAEEARHRTVYISRLSPMCLQTTLRSLLDECGTVNKVRVCHEKGYATLFGFVEMKTAQGAANVVAKDRTEVAGGATRFQPAKSAVLDVEASDAVASADGSPLKPCAYGLGTGGLLVSQGKEFKAK